MIDDIFSRVAENLIGRVSGPMKFRLVLQPMMAAIFAIRAGLKDAKEGRPAYFWAIFTEPALRRDLIKEGWSAVGKVFIIAIIIDAIYQYIVLGWFYPGEAILVAAILALIPYLLIRGPVNRIARRRRS
jgi:TRAP-type C4-dicarboxylate transport system permease large subunit